MRVEYRAEQEDVIRDAAELFRHRRTLHDVLCDHAMRGDVLALTTGSHRLIGSVQAVGDDVVTLAIDGTGTDVVIDATRALSLEVVRTTLDSRQSRPRQRTSLRARLLEREMVGSPIELATVVDERIVRGFVHVGADHVAVTNDQRAVTVSFPAIAWVRTAS